MLKKWVSKNTYKIIAIAAVGMLIVGLIPLLLISQYAHPCADDFTYGYYTHAFWSTTHSLSQTLKWALYQVKATYDTWQGTFSSVFLMALSPAIWGEKYYFLTTVIMLSMVIFPHFYLFYIIVVKLLRAPKTIWCIISSVISFLLIETVHSPVNAFFWFNGAVHYVFMHGCMVMLFGIMLRFEDSNASNGWVKEVLLYAIACILAAACGGANYSTALVGLLGIIFLAVLKWGMGQRKLWKLLPIVVYVFAFYKNVTAYGNVIRQSNFTKASPIEAVGGSFEQLFHCMGNWITIPVLLFMLILIPFLWKIVGIDRFDFRLPPLVTALSVCAAACMFTPSLYAMGGTGPDRLLNIAKMWFYLLVFLNEGYWIGYLRRRFLGKLPAKMPNLYLYVIGILCLVFVSFLISVETRLYDYSSYAAYVSLKAGEAQAYDAEYGQRLALLEGADTDVVLEAFSVKPRLLYFDDIIEDKYNWKNMAVARWYGKDSVILKETD